MRWVCQNREYAGKGNEIVIVEAEEQRSFYDTRIFVVSMLGGVVVSEGDCCCR